MKSEPKAFASLSSGLLARKGAARPAMRPQGFGQAGGSLEDLGWNDMGFEPPKPAAVPIRDDSHDAFGEEIDEAPVRHASLGLSPVDSPVHDQQAEIAGRLSAFTPADADEEEADDTAELYNPEGEAADIEEAAEAVEAVEAVEPVAVIAQIPQRRAKPVFEAPVVEAAPVPVRRRSPAARAAAGSKAKSAFTLRLDAERHLKLRLACAIGGQSAQMLVTAALDQWLATLPELDGLAKKAKPKG